MSLNGPTPIPRGGYGIYDDLLLSQYLLISGVRNPPFYLRGDVSTLRQGDFPRSRTRG